MNTLTHGLAPEQLGCEEISRESLMKILEIMHRLAAPEAMPELLREIIEVGKLAIVAEAGVLWLLDRDADELVMVSPSSDAPLRRRLGDGWVGVCAQVREMSNIHECRDDDRFQADPLNLPGFETRSLFNVPIIGQDDSLLGVMQWLGARPGQFDHHDEWVGPALAAQAAVAVQHAYMTDELLANAILEREVAVAREIQLSTLPSELPEVDGYGLYGHFLPTSHTGGDLYDLVMLDGQLFMLLGDATGHGFGPALSATQMQAMMRVAFRLGAGLDDAYRQVNNQMAEDLPDDRFITAFMGFLDPASHQVQFHSAGQGPILHYHAAEDRLEWHKPTSFPLGVMELETGAQRAKQLQLAPGDILALVSDGIYEFANANGEQFGEAGVGDVVRRYRGRPVAELGQALVDAAFAFGGDVEQADDITLVLVRRDG
ncbi:SpoIIE family protein phosphatase [Marinihelvus fidelis]|uniref:SpoIIE family protein phosphatase n=1 Tax=Marinihelvus fidelis TaxID=2613842 RepID=A0A5N0TE64_9GAMM|nr:GAF domain-containing SpoIIE family protein phosphatase [Marinihelvus fidelis]KAA9133332.1 SpoIIE family protein phosphatase [Marinihelvus fidelis]